MADRVRLLTTNEDAVLRVLTGEIDYDFRFLCFNSISAECGLERKIIRRACRSLKRKGLAEFSSMLSDADGSFRGSGYGATHAGYDTAEVMRRHGGGGE